MTGHPHMWRREELPSGGVIAVCAGCKVRRDAFTIRDLDPDADRCPVGDPSCCRAIGAHGAICRAAPGHSGPHDGGFGCTFGWGADFTERMSIDLWKPGARTDPQFICGLCGAHYLDHHGDWRAHFDEQRARKGAA